MKDLPIYILIAALLMVIGIQRVNSGIKSQGADVRQEQGEKPIIRAASLAR